MNTYRDVSPTVRTWEPNRAPQPAADVGTPLLSALVTAILLSAVPTSLLLLWPIDHTLALLITGFCLAALIAWLAERHILRRTLWRVEEHVGDLNDDGLRGEPPPVVRPVLVGVHKPSPRAKADQAETAWLEEVEWFVQTCFRVGFCGEKKLIGRPKPNGYKLNQEGYDRLRDLLIGAKYAAWNNPEDPEHRTGWSFVPEIRPGEIMLGLKQYV